MPTLFLMVGLPGSGKTTMASQLERDQPALRLTPDEWIQTLYATKLTQEELDGAREPVESMQWAVAARAITLGIDVILDFGFWTRKEREDFRARAAALGAGSELRFSEVTDAELSRRLVTRNSHLPANTFHVSEAQLEAWAKEFEKPSSDELQPREPPRHTS